MMVNRSRVPNMEFTGERYVPDVDRPELAYAHWHRYFYAAEWAAGKSVLDIGCGEGYGCSLLAEKATKVVGLDADPTTVAYAAATYARPHLHFIAGLAEAIPIGGEHVFDLVVCFETIEHLDRDQQAACAAAIKRLLKPDGLFLVSTPDKQLYNRGQPQGNPFHRHEFTRDEFAGYLQNTFASVHLLGQKVYPVSYVWPIASPLRSASEHQVAFAGRQFVPAGTDRKENRYLIAVCSNGRQKAPHGSVLLDVSERATQGRKDQLAIVERQLADRDRVEIEAISRLTAQLGSVQDHLHDAKEDRDSLRRAADRIEQIQRAGDNWAAERKQRDEREAHLLRLLERAREQFEADQQRLAEQLEARLIAADQARRLAEEAADQRLAEAHRRLVEAEAARRAEQEAANRWLTGLEANRRTEREAAQRQIDETVRSLAAAEQARNVDAVLHDHRSAELERERLAERAAADQQLDVAQRAIADLEAARRTDCDAIGELVADRARLLDNDRSHASVLAVLDQRYVEALARHDAELTEAHRALETSRQEADAIRQELIDARRDVDALQRDVDIAGRRQAEARRELGDALRRVAAAEAGRRAIGGPAGASSLAADPGGTTGPSAPPDAANSNGNGRSVDPITTLVALNGADQSSTLLPDAIPTDIVVCVHNALDDVTPCLAALDRYTGPDHRLILVDDGSDPVCRDFLAAFARSHPACVLERNDQSVGYTRAANQGLRRATKQFVVLLNSDTLVTPRWLDRLWECAASDPKIGIVGPLANAASYQSVPERVGPSGDWALNPLPSAWGPDHVAEAVALISTRAFPRVPFLNGFCLAIKRAVIDTIGYFDEQTFPEGYGEENDYCLRACAAGFDLAVADHAYVYHAKSRSFTHQRRKDLSRDGRAGLETKHGRDALSSREALIRDEPALATLRRRLAAHLKETSPLPAPIPAGALRVLFLLPVRGGGGGAHSIAQEARGLRLLGVDAQVAINRKHVPLYRESYPALSRVPNLFHPYASVEDLAADAAGFDVVVGTIFTSISLLETIVARHPSVVPAYYVQDYEPWFFPEGAPDRAVALSSYTLLPRTILFAKTRWLCDMVRTLHDVEMHKVSPSLDHDVYFPALDAPASDGPVRVAAMIRPATPRRGAPRTMGVLQRLHRDFAERVDIHIFGCEDGDIAKYGLESDFAFTNHGSIIREDVAQLLRDADVFLDLSDYQAFGRTALEAMACGCAVVVPARGGADEYAVHGQNALLVDTDSYKACLKSARMLVTDADLRRQLRQAAIATADEYSIHRAALSERSLFESVRAAQGTLVAGTA
jgi:GT2 family glycosyltransferase/glycosyltransferase involved in cell wall biosynthesis/SAM-dependent methyltransferase